MTKYSDGGKKKFTRESIIGLGEESFRKNYYPELQSKILDLEKTNARNRAILNTIPDILMVGDEEGRVTPFSYRHGSDQGFIQAFFVNRDLMGKLSELSIEVMASREMVTLPFEQMIEDEPHSFEARINISDSNETLIMIRDITQQVRLEDELRQMAERDAMTGLYNRRIFEEEMFAKEDKATEGIALIILDIDGLKLINDTVGHEVGDQVIKIVGKEVQDRFEAFGLVARLSGDEFGVMSECLDGDAIEQIMKRMKATIDEINGFSKLFQISVSYGYGIYVGQAFDPRALFREADNNMYQNKMFKASSVRSGLVRTLMKALEAKDFITEGHADRMESLTEELGRAIGLGQNKIDRLMLLAKFHDIGKVGIPDRILNKPGKLDEQEYRIMKTHSQIGRRIALASPELSDIADLIYHHHEKWDGTGYPLGVVGEAIPIECRILALVDTYDAMTNDRPYRKALPHEAAMKEIRIHKGRQFDPTLVEAFVEMMD